MSTCSCNATCYGYSACYCNYACYAGGNPGTPETCGTTNVITACNTCDQACYGYAACSCNSTCYSHFHGTVVFIWDGWE